MRLILGLSTLAAAATAEPRTDWNAIARSDVLAAYALFAENHPGMKDPTNPGFRTQLTEARDVAMKIAQGTKDLRGYRAALAAFSAKLSDGHALVYAVKGAGDDPVEWLWPGFVAAWRGTGAVVHHAGPHAPAPEGSAILSCDGRPVASIIRDRLAEMPFRPAEAGQWWISASFAFRGRSGPDRAQPQHCTFRLPDGSMREAPLSWTPEPSNMWELHGATLGEQTPIGLTEPRPGLFLVGLPSFRPDEAGVKAYQTLYAEIDRQRSALKKAKALVLDLRFNDGGSSEWSREVARRLWGKSAVDGRMAAYHRPVRHWWRASRDNLAFMPEMEANVRRNGHIAIAEEVRKITAGMKAALAAGRDFHVEEADMSPRRGGRPAATDLDIPVYVIAYGGCASACLDAVDVFKRFPTVKLIGAPTSADSTYMVVRRAELPSGEGRIVIPLKIWMNRPRGAGQVYRPDIEMNGLAWSTAAFLDRIERDLAARR